MFRKPEPPNPLREAFTRHLRNADDYARKKEYEKALYEIEQALKLDPKNNNARQFQERVRMQWKQVQKDQKLQEAAVELSFEQRMEVIPKFLATADRMISQHDYKAALDAIAEIYKVDSTNYYAQAYSDRIDQLMSEEMAKASQVFQPAQAATGAEEETKESGSLGFYRELLKDYWFDGKLTDDELRHLAEVRGLFAIADEDHERISKDVKFDAYVEALRLAWADGFLSETERKVLEIMRNRYNISLQENARAEAKVQELRKSHPQRDLVLIVDASQEHAVGLAKVLKTRGFNTMVARRPEEAYKILHSSVPVAIVADVRFGPGDGDGFELYRRVRQFPPLVHAPFFFALGMTDNDILHAALRVGVDHVLQKPVDPEFIVAAIEGKRQKV